MALENVISLTQKLIAFNTINPPGNEKESAKVIGNLLSTNGFDVEYISFEKNRLHILAEKGVSDDELPIIFSGHLDTVPLGANEWSVHPFNGEIKDGKLFGRGTTDMKGGVAAIVLAAIQAFDEGTPKGGVKLFITAGEELGCQGAQQLVGSRKKWAGAKGLIIAEPTANIPATGHKGGLYIKVSATGVTAHSSMPELGDNAIYKIARAISKIEKFQFNAENDGLLGLPTINVGRMNGGININSVPDYAEFTIDVRSTTKVNHSEIIKQLKRELGSEMNFEVLVDLKAVSTNENNPFVDVVYRACNVDRDSNEFPKALPYLTDGSVLQSAFKGVPTIILGPGEPQMAHQTDEFIFIDKLKQSVEIYKKIILERG